MNSYLIIGSNSFSGSNFINYLLNKGSTVIGISRSKEINPEYLKYKDNDKIKNFKFIQCNLTQTKKIIKIIKKYKTNVIVNFAAQGMVEQSWENPIDWYETNIIYTISLIEKLSRIKFVNRFVQFSTPEVYGNTKKWVRENSKFNPSTPYAISRACSDMHLNILNKYKGFPFIITRTANVYGPHQQLYRVLPKLIIKCLNKKKFYIDGKGNSERSFIFIDDVNEALYKIIKKGKSGGTYHISTNNLISIKKLALLVCKKLNADQKFIIRHTKERLGKDMYYKLRSNQIRRDFNWKEKVKLEEGIEKTIIWIKKNYKNFNKQKLSYLHKK